MVQHKPTPEEQLLKLIEGGGDPRPGTSPDLSGRSSAGKSKSSSVAGKIPGFLEYARKTFLKDRLKMPSGFVFGVKTLNQVLLALVIASIVFLFVDLVFFKPDDRRFLEQVSTTDAVYPLRTGSVEKISSDISAYKNAAQKRNPFLPPSAVVLPGPADSGAGEKSEVGVTGTLSDALQGIKLVGISWSDNPLAMIEDVSTGRTFFLRKDQEFRGVKVQDISKEKVTVTYQGQEGDLF